MAASGTGISVTPPPAPSQGEVGKDLESSDCCKIPSTNREFWVNKIRRNKERDREEQKQLAAMGWHCITVWECELKPKVREKTLESLAFTLNHIWLEDVRCKKEDGSPSTDSGTSERAYSIPEEEPMMAAEEEDV